MPSILHHLRLDTVRFDFADRIQVFYRILLSWQAQLLCRRQLTRLSYSARLSNSSGSTSMRGRLCRRVPQVIGMPQRLACWVFLMFLQGTALPIVNGQDAGLRFVMKLAFWSYLLSSSLPGPFVPAGGPHHKGPPFPSRSLMKNKSLYLIIGIQTSMASQP